MKRTIKRTEITIETVEITTIRRTPEETGEKVELRREVTISPLVLCGTAGQVEPVREIEIEEKQIT